MPTAYITVAPDLIGPVTERAEEIIGRVSEILTDGLDANPELVQVVLTAALAAPQGCDVLCQVQHRASAARNKQVRQATARNLHDVLKAATGSTVRVRLLALDPSWIAGADGEQVS